MIDKAEIDTIEGEINEELSGVEIDLIEDELGACDFPDINDAYIYTEWF